MSTTFRAYVPDQSLLLPPDVREWLPEGHLAHHVSDLVDGLDLTAFIPVFGRWRVPLNRCYPATYGGGSVTASRNCQPNRSPDPLFEYGIIIHSWRSWVLARTNGVARIEERAGPGYAGIQSGRRRCHVLLHGRSLCHLRLTHK